MGQEINFVVGTMGAPNAALVAQFADATDVLAQAMANRNEDGTRKLATVRYIKDLLPIGGADFIELAVVDGWKVVVQKGLHVINDMVIYIEIDSWVPYEIAPFLSKGQEPKEYEGIKGNKLRTIKLRGTTSQGLILPLDEFPEIFNEIKPQIQYQSDIDAKAVPNNGDLQQSVLSAIKNDPNFDNLIGMDVTKLLGIKKWEPQIPANMAGLIKGDFPSWGKKTDAERIQNLTNEFESYKDIQFEVTIKLDGTSMSVGISPNSEYTVCSRNLSLKTEQEGNTFINLMVKYGLEEKLRLLNRPILISGEFIGPGIQKNHEKITSNEYYVFNIWDPLTMSYISAKERINICNQLGLKHVPVLYESVLLNDLNINTVDDILEFANGPSLKAATREGLVYKSIDGKIMFKTISNKWLIKDSE